MVGECDNAWTAGLGEKQELESNLGLELLLDGPWSIVLADAAGKLTFLNRAALSLFELQSGSDHQFGALWPPAEQAVLARKFQDAIEGQSAQINVFCPKLDGTPRWLEAAVTPVKSGTGTHAPRVMCSVRDITQQIAVQESLKSSQQRFRALADHMAQLAWMADETGHLFWYNARWFEFTGTTMADMEGWGWTLVQHPDHLDRVIDKWAEHLRSGEVWEDVFPLRGADGTYRWFLSRAMPFRDASGRIILWCGTNTDITEQRNATQRLRQKARLIELSHEAIFSWDLDGAIVSWNRGCQELYGYSEKEAIGAISHELLKSKHAVPLSEVRKMLLADGAWSGEILHYAKDGTKVWVDSRHEVLNVGGKSIVLETNRDITERRKSDEIRNLLVAELNHRVKNTLAIVQSIASQTARSSSNMHEYAENLRGRLQSLASAHNVLTDSHWHGADLLKLVKSEADVTFGQSPNVVICGDPVFLSPQTALHFNLLLHELATNALKHGALSSATGRVEIFWKPQASDTSKLEFTWRESGGPSVNKPQRKGFGTSLIARSSSLPNIKAELSFRPEGVECRIIADLKDEADVEPLFNPVRTESPLVMGPRTARQTKRSAGLRVLVVEPEPLLALEIEDSLHEAGHSAVGPATTIQSALEAIARGGIHVVIADSGSVAGAALEILIARCKEENLPYILVGSPEDLQRWSGSGVPMLPKPVRPMALFEALAGLTPAKGAQGSSI